MNFHSQLTPVNQIPQNPFPRGPGLSDSGLLRLGPLEGLLPLRRLTAPGVRAGAGAARGARGARGAGAGFRLLGFQALALLPLGLRDRSAFWTHSTNEIGRPPIRAASFFGNPYDTTNPNQFVSLLKSSCLHQQEQQLRVLAARLLLGAD